MNDVSVRICDVKPGALCTKNHHVSGIVRMAWELRNCGRGDAFDELSFQDDGPLAGAAGVRCVFQVEIGAIDSAEIDPLAATRCSTDRADAMPSYDNAPAPGGAGSTASGSASCAASNTTSNTIMVYFYNRWAELAAQASTSKVARPPTHDVAKAPIKQSDKLQLRGSLAVFDATQGPTGSDTARPGSLPTDHPYCIVVAEDALLPSSLNACAAVEASLWQTVQLLGLPISEIRYCPHSASPVACYCRKPLPGFGVDLIRRYGLSREHLVMVGDRESDADFARNVGARFEWAEDFFA